MPLFKADKKQIEKNAGKWNVIISENMCKACGFCLNVCPVDVFAWRKTPNRLGWVPMFVEKEANCIGCMLCYQICPDFCIDVGPKGVPELAVSQHAAVAEPLTSAGPLTSDEEARGEAWRSYRPE
jgi:2-oxoglutarate ferredoxin oxidoreductase subunit delta